MPPQREATLERETAYVPTATSPTHGAMNRRRYVESLQDGREVWIDGELVRDVTVHPAFRHMISHWRGSTTCRTVPNIATR